jgi:hypothetical protein
MVTTDAIVNEIMDRAGYEAAKAGGGNWWWTKPVADGSKLCVCTVEGSLDGDPEVEEWYAGRHTDDGFVECSEALTLAEALLVVEQLPAPDGEVQRRMSRREIEAA